MYTYSEYESKTILTILTIQYFHILNIVKLYNA